MPPLLLPGLRVEDCGADPSSVCSWVYDRTGNSVLANAADWFIGRPLTIIVILLAAWLVAKIARRAIRRTSRRIAYADSLSALATVRRPASRADDASTASGEPTADPRRLARASSIAGVLSSTASVTIWVIALILVIGELGINLAPLIAGAGILGVALGFGAQSLVRDCVSGLFMIIEDQYGIGDIVDLGSASGTVDRISLRATVLRGPDGTVWHVPNGEVLRVGNRSQLWSIALVDVLIPHSAPLDDTKTAIADIATEICASPEFAADVVEPPEVLGVENITAEGVTVRLRAKTTAGSQLGLQRALREGIKRRLDERGVQTPHVGLGAVAPSTGPPTGGPVS